MRETASDGRSPADSGASDLDSRQPLVAGVGVVAIHRLSGVPYLPASRIRARSTGPERQAQMRAKRLAGVDLSTEAASEIFPLFSKAFVFTLVMLGALLAFGLYQRENQRNELGYTGRLIISFLPGLLIMMIILYAAPALALGRGAFGLTVLFAFTGVLAARAVFLRLADRGAFGRHILVLGAGPAPPGWQSWSM